MDWSWEKGGAYINVPVTIKPRKAKKMKLKLKPPHKRHVKIPKKKRRARDIGRIKKCS